MKNNFDIFTTTLSVSPHKNAMIINAIGEDIAADCTNNSKKATLKWLPADFKKKEGYKKSIEVAHTVFQADANPSPNTANYKGYITLTTSDGETYYLNKISQSDGYSYRKYDIINFNLLFFIFHFLQFFEI